VEEIGSLVVVTDAKGPMHVLNGFEQLRFADQILDL
jgi:hypothetical protein